MEILISDLGNVILLHNLRRAYETLARLGGRDVHDLIRAGEPTRKQAGAGQINAQDFRRRLCSEAGIQLSRPRFSEIWNSIWTPNEPFMEFLHTWKASGGELYLLSNIDGIHWEYCRRTYADVFQQFDRCFVSYRMKMRKPDVRMFLEVIAHVQVPPSHCLFVDDYAQNTQAARSIGMHAWHYKASAHDVFLDYVRAMTG